MVQNPRAEPVYQLLNRSIACRSSVERSVGTHEGLSLLQKGGGVSLGLSYPACHFLAEYNFKLTYRQRCAALGCMCAQTLESHRTLESM